MKMFISDPKLATSLYSEIRVAWDGSFKTTMLMSFPAAPSIIAHWSRTLDKIRWNKKKLQSLRNSGIKFKSIWYRIFSIGIQIR